jgi:hypothetical protein
MIEEQEKTVFPSKNSHTSDKTSTQIPGSPPQDFRFVSNPAYGSSRVLNIPPFICQTRQNFGWVNPPNKASPLNVHVNIALYKFSGNHLRSFPPPLPYYQNLMVNLPNVSNKQIKEVKTPIVQPAQRNPLIKQEKELTDNESCKSDIPDSSKSEDDFDFDDSTQEKPQPFSSMFSSSFNNITRCIIKILKNQSLKANDIDLDPLQIELVMIFIVRKFNLNISNV